jgi:hypothetical protein
LPSNIITINRCRELEWIIPDSKMEKVISVLDEYGDKFQDSISSDTSSSPDSQIDCQASHRR